MEPPRSYVFLDPKNLRAKRLGSCKASPTARWALGTAGVFFRPSKDTVDICGWASENLQQLIDGQHPHYPPVN